MRYFAPVSDTLFFSNDCTSLKRLSDEGVPDLARSRQKRAEEAGKFMSEQIAPRNCIGDIECNARERVVHSEALEGTYQAWCAAGWRGFPARRPNMRRACRIVNMACVEFWTARRWLSAWAAAHHRRYRAWMPCLGRSRKNFRRLFREWTGTMQLTEPQAP